MTRGRKAPAPEVFIDTGFIIAMLDNRDGYHAAAARWHAHYAGRPRLTTTAVLMEAGNGFATRDRWRTFATFLTDLRVDPAITIITVDVGILDRAVDLRRKNPARKWGLVDCTSFVVMRDHGITDALAGDKHFTEAGFDALLLRP